MQILFLCLFHIITAVFKGNILLKMLENSTAIRPTNSTLMNCKRDKIAVGVKAKRQHEYWKPLDFWMHCWLSPQWLAQRKLITAAQNYNKLGLHWSKRSWKYTVFLYSLWKQSKWNDGANHIQSVCGMELKHNSFLCLLCSSGCSYWFGQIWNKVWNRRLCVSQPAAGRSVCFQKGDCTC